MKQKPNLLIILCALFLLSGCSSLFDNRTKLAKEGLEAQINQESQGAIKLVSFENTDGVERTEEGIHIYTMDFKITIEYQEECNKNGGELGGWLYSDFAVFKRPPQGWDAYLGGQGRRYQKGAKVAITGTMDFEKKESGWNISGFKLLRSDDVK